ncbi:hypothetical protein [Priestia megaterium]|uniref:hypothetical protein n=1 Tax=Priestia megaterium TaxID=1404 RepID=UPI002E236A0A|nr:hypothetical protein [Priestia megaterium]
MILKNQVHMPPQCPPVGAIPGNVSPVYRFIENEKLEEIDFQNHIERKRPYPPNKTCEALAISFFTSTQSARNMSKKFKTFRNKTLLAGKITTECGRHQTQHQHLNLWLYENVDMVKIFQG